MLLRDFLSKALSDYSSDDGTSGPIHALLRSAGRELEDVRPPGLRVRGSGGQFNRSTETPWVALMNPDETRTPQQGLYLVYLFASDMQSVSLSLNQGVTAVQKRTKSTGAALTDAVRDIADSLWSAIETQRPASAERALGIGDSGWRQQAYEAANIAAIRYEGASLPSEEVLVGDLLGMVGLYDAAIAARNAIQIASGEKSTPPQSRKPADVGALTLGGFKPKSPSDYWAQIPQRLERRTRQHEDLVAKYSAFLKDASIECHTPHPVDLVAVTSGGVWIVEAKVLKQGNATQAVREAIGQLFHYRYLHWTLSGEPAPAGIVALFSEPIGDLYVDLLHELGIEAV
ncbi:MAG: DUF3578 domain-containing protein [Chloroflexi bacterium]|nr:DUF3578 domain-containing protein [Chloroflexota bacterium]